MASQGIDKLEVKGFKTFADAGVELTSCNVLIGGNGAGKSNFLSLLKMLRALARGELQVFVEKAGRANGVLHRSIPTTMALQIGLDFRTTTGKGRYRVLAERTEDDRLLIRSEETEAFDASGQSLGIGGHANPVRESVLSLAAPAHLPGKRELFALMLVLKNLRVFHFAETAVAAPAAYECDFGDNGQMIKESSWSFHHLRIKTTSWSNSKPGRAKWIAFGRNSGRYKSNSKPCFRPSLTGLFGGTLMKRDMDLVRQLLLGIKEKGGHPYD